MKLIPATVTSMYEYDPNFEVILYGELAKKKWIQREIFCNICNQKIGIITTKSDLENACICFRCDRKEDEGYDNADFYNRENIQVRKHILEIEKCK